jgi:hypothetical protein
VKAENAELSKTQLCIALASILKELLHLQGFFSIDLDLQRDWDKVPLKRLLPASRGSIIQEKVIEGVGNDGHVLCKNVDYGALAVRKSSRLWSALSRRFPGMEGILGVSRVQPLGTDSYWLRFSSFSDPNFLTATNLNESSLKLSGEAILQGGPPYRLSDIVVYDHFCQGCLEPS